MSLRFHFLAKLLAFALVAFACTFSSPAIACMCNCSIFSSPAKDPAATGFNAAEYEQIFSGLVLSTEHIPRPFPPPAPGENFVEDPGYWAKSNILVLRIWKGAPSTVAEVWTLVRSDCDVPPLPVSYFRALVRTEEGRSVAGNTFCDCDEKAAATEGPGVFTISGITLTAAAVAAAALMLLALVKAIRRRWLSLRSSQNIPRA